MKKTLDLQAFIGSALVILLLGFAIKMAHGFNQPKELAADHFSTKSQGVNAALPISQYRVFFGKINPPEQGQAFILRRFLQDNKTYYLTLNPQTLQTAVLPANAMAVDSLSIEQFRQMTAASPYGKALHEDATNDQQLQDAGLIHSDAKARGIDLTIDLCPSLRPLTRNLFTQLIAVFSPEELPIPLTIAISGVWMQQHPSDLAWLRGLEKSGKLNITWVNHSLHHRYDPKLPLPENFLLEKNTDLNAEVLGNEQAMLENGLRPSLFFRFPGLVSNRVVFDIITDFGLLPLGSDAWLAKGQQATQGSIVLVHGNGNEPVGVADFIKLLKAKSPLIHKKKWLLLDLNSSVAAVEK